ncbi:hypothetical protein ALNOE001_19640 [Candidatus Methanobinarius endosymbioticus]|uniref:Big-1 domain-containing protein n=1 Tax=Candidatus Methanobinarius endosymbioticus TaxID=2006182 RepID=A0A366M950_9EURY|nr:hypothetical protein ALNOE001_19640 [Candidatus Methanobinarius endosymbioticus]
MVETTGNLFNGLAGFNVYVNNTEQFSNNISIVGVEIVNNIIVKTTVYCYDKYNQVGVSAGRTVQFIVNGVVYIAVTDENEYTVLLFNSSRNGNYSLSVVLNTTVYDYDNSRWNNTTYYVYKYSNNTATFEVPMVLSDLVVNIGDGYVGDEIKITGILTDKNGDSMINQKITFKKDGKIIGYGTTDANGKLVISYLVSQKGPLTVHTRFYGPIQVIILQKLALRKHSTTEEKQTQNLNLILF